DKVLDIHECLLQPAPSNDIRNFIREKAIDYGLSFFNPRSQKGFLRNLIIRTTETGDLMVIVVIAPSHTEAIEPLLTDLRQTFPQITSLLSVINPNPNDTIFDLDVHVFHGSEFITEQMGSKFFRIGPKSFFQTNTRQARVLYDEVIKMADFAGHETVYDLYSGLGSIGIYLADRVSK